MRANGNSYTTIDENDSYLMVEGSTPSGYIFWEIWKKRYLKEDKYVGGTLMGKEGDLIKPSNEHFGLYAWCYTDKEKAIWKMRN
jgi:hypothetical protein